MASIRLRAGRRHGRVVRCISAMVLGRPASDLSGRMLWAYPDPTEPQIRARDGDARYRISTSPSIMTGDPNGSSAAPSDRPRANAAVFAIEVHHEVGESVDDLRLGDETGSGVDQSQHPHPRDDTVEVSDLASEIAQDRQPSGARRFVSLLDRQVETDLASRSRWPSIRAPRPMPGDHGTSCHEPNLTPLWLISLGDLHRRRKHQSHLSELRLNLHHAPSAVRSGEGPPQATAAIDNTVEGDPELGVPHTCPKPRDGGVTTRPTRTVVAMSLAVQRPSN